MNGVVGIGTYAPYYRAWWGRAAQVTIEGMLNCQTNLMMVFLGLAHPEQTEQ